MERELEEDPKNRDCYHDGMMVDGSIETEEDEGTEGRGSGPNFMDVELRISMTRTDPVVVERGPNDGERGTEGPDLNGQR